MDLSKRVVYDAEFPIVMLRSEDSDVGKPVTFYVTSMQSKKLQKLERESVNNILVRKQSRGNTSLTIDDIDDREKTERAKLIATISRWEWNGNSFGDLGKDPAFTPENVAAIVDHENSGWIVDLLYAGAANIGNFTQK